ncbi:MAG: peptidase domain-containing ABC transporter, partial [Saprospiraceae bacterium]
MFITGQLNVPLQQITAFVRAAQDARLSLERLGEVSGGKSAADSDQRESRPTAGRDTQLVMDGGRKGENITIDSLSFRYNALSGFVLKNINLEIPAGKVTAIVGSSGSGKTTLIKLLLGFYEPSEGSIRLGATPLAGLAPRVWRSHCGAVMQDGFVFSDTFLANITESDPANIPVDETRLEKAVQTAHLHDFIESLPMGYQTMVGARGNGLSQGQRQRLLIARAVYKEPEFLFFDEATNALDARNERIIMENLNRFFTGRTVVIVAHRLSTVKNADNIAVLENGELIEEGTHEILVQKKGAYYRLVKEQLELGG